MALRQHIKFSRHFYNVANSADKKLIVRIVRILVNFGLRQLHQLALLRLPIFWFSRNIFYFDLRDVNSLMSTCDISNNETIISIFEHFVTKFHELPELPSY